MGLQKFKFDIGEEVNIGNFHGVILDKYRNAENRKSYKYECLDCGYKGEKTEILIVKGVGCSCCSGRAVCPGINDIPTTDPWMIPFFQGGKEEASLYTKSSGKKIIPRCPDCGRILQEQKINNIYNHKGVSCICQDNISFPNKIIYFLMEQLYADHKISCFMREYYVKANNKYFDMYFETNNSEKYFVEMDGGINHGYITQKHDRHDGFKAYPISTFRDDITKERIDESLGVTLIRIDCYYSDFEYIKKNIISSELSNILDFNSLDWKKIESQSYSNLVKLLCDYRKNNPCAFVKDAAEKFHLDPETIRRYWERGNKLEWCEFDRISEKSRSQKSRNYYGNSCRIILENIETKEKTEFDSMSDFVRKHEEYFGVSTTRKIIGTMFKKNDNVIKNYKGFNIYKLRRNCDGI